MCMPQRYYSICIIRGYQGWIIKRLRAVIPIKSHGSCPFSGSEPVFGSLTCLKGKQSLWNKRLQHHGNVRSNDSSSSSPKRCITIYSGHCEKGILCQGRLDIVLKLTLTSEDMKYFCSSLKIETYGVRVKHGL